MQEASSVVRENALSLQFHTILLDAMLTGLALAMASSWSLTVLACVEEWIDTSGPTQHLISSLVITAFSIAFAVVAVFALAAPRVIIYKCARAARYGARALARRRRKRPSKGGFGNDGPGSAEVKAGDADAARAPSHEADMSI